MNYYEIFHPIINIFILITCFAIAYLLVEYLIKPKVLEPLCMINSEDCMEFDYFIDGNNVLINTKPNGYWIWIENDLGFVYGTQMNNNRCKDPESFEPVFRISNNKDDSWFINDYKCVQPLTQTLKKFKDKNIKKRTFKYKLPSKMLRSKGLVINQDGDLVTEIGNKLTANDVITIFKSKKIL